jgi:type 1 fimbria pilin
MTTSDKKTKALLLSLILSPLFILSESAMAACHWGAGISAPENKPLTFGSVMVRADAPVGTVLAVARTDGYHGSQALFVCDSAYAIQGTLLSFPTLSAYGNNVYNTNIRGVGLRIGEPSTKFPTLDDMSPNENFYLDGEGVVAQLVKTVPGSVGAGRVIAGTLIKYEIVSYPEFHATAYLGSDTYIIPVACSINNTVINVRLDNAVEADFSGVGSVAKPKDFTVGVNCASGTQVKMTLDGKLAGPTGVLALNAGTDQASGIGIQLLKDGTPVDLGTELNFGTATMTGNLLLPLTARYYQTAASIAGGKTNASATFTMTYN